MNYYKLIDGDTIIGVVTYGDFLTYQQKHKTMLACDEESAQYVRCGDALYRAMWMTPVSTDVIDYTTVEVIRIEKEEYDILHTAIEKGEDIKKECEQPVFEEYVPPIDQYEVATVDYLKTSKIAEMSYVCNRTIEDGVDVKLSDGNERHFSLTTQDQLNLITLQSMIDSGATSIPYHADGELCRYYSVDDIQNVINQATAHTTFHVTYFNSLKAYICSLDDITSISKVEYGMDIPIEYQSDILQALYAAMGGKQ